MFTRIDVFKIVDALFYKFDSVHRQEARVTVSAMMDQIESKDNPCHCRGDKTCIFCGADMNQIEAKDDSCKCPQGSTCEFFKKTNECCLYGKI